MAEYQQYTSVGIVTAYCTLLELLSLFICVFGKIKGFGLSLMTLSSDCSRSETFIIDGLASLLRPRSSTTVSLAANKGKSNSASEPFDSCIPPLLSSLSFSQLP